MSGNIRVGKDAGKRKKDFVFHVAQVGGSKYEGHGFELSRNSFGRWVLKWVEDSGDGPVTMIKHYALKKQAVEFAEKWMDKNKLGWRQHYTR